jgi:hypothetical protein
MSISGDDEFRRRLRAREAERLAAETWMREEGRKKRIAQQGRVYVESVMLAVARAAQTSLPLIPIGTWTLRSFGRTKFQVMGEGWVITDFIPQPKQDPWADSGFGSETTGIFLTNEGKCYYHHGGGRRLSKLFPSVQPNVRAVWVKPPLSHQNGFRFAYFGTGAVKVHDYSGKPLELAAEADQNFILDALAAFSSDNELHISGI